MAIGYACLTVAVVGTDLRSCTIKNATSSRLKELVAGNLDALQRMVKYNVDNHIAMFRISSDLIPFGSHPELDWPWEREFAQQFSAIGDMIRRSKMRIAVHPGQYTVLNSPHADVTHRAVLDLVYHAKMLDSLGLDHSHKITLHLGGAYNDKASAGERFIRVFCGLPSAVARRLVIENDGVIYSIDEVLAIARWAGIPVVYDNLHNITCPPLLKRTDAEWIAECQSTWGPEDGQQEVHYSQQHPQKRAGAHSDTIDAVWFADFYRAVSGDQLDITLEVKDKNISALKCQHSVTGTPAHFLRQEWGKYTSLVKERSETAAAHLQAMVDRSANSVLPYQALEFYRSLDDTLQCHPDPQQSSQVFNQMWSQFSSATTITEQRAMAKTCAQVAETPTHLAVAKAKLHRLAEKYEVDDLLATYYFVK